MAGAVATYPGTSKSPWAKIVGLLLYIALGLGVLSWVLLVLMVQPVLQVLRAQLAQIGRASSRERV